ncbi:undecaprenyldiphospho-muramoylpentapeptide beta-N-acetylglucosaminyltransferase [Echinimonas agarilytica]|uniref:UDP-N-acetylglucosamine--N-acetylmuramyl-(pentapeptide) pyrophosphoryl-undecaprenol N-acetylglucosamine transferase n=1 Tax=Echinimonas agarilytica TaxID=1215918 RepID=A0AA41W4Z1_9GAMM|nr:undecaprenyldiphospho-muramoylpentapeptide beta-N-acetylglucosaminyltransferase [Echinimonas agarilytica]MCM2678779.1 undecaprenyldiphospho-muramoylpentapeptide beta-N-acetylglucosaminyltransferase [Echinimonas agarilytica]
MTDPRAVIMAGGTGGHVFPGLAVADVLKNTGWQIDWLGTAERMEAELVPRHGYPIHFIDIQGVRGNGLIRKVTAPFKILKAILQARQLFKQLRPDVVIGMGGFASGPGALAAKIAGIPIVLHEQNAIAGMTNRYVSKFADKVMMAFEGAFADGQCVGNPVRAELFAIEAPVERAEQLLRILVVGGSLGAKILNDIVPKTIDLLRKDGPVDVWHQAGKNNGEDVFNKYQAFGINPVHADDFIHEIDQAYSWADLVICRAGALTVSELAAVGRPAILVPLPHAVDDHQTANAKVLQNADAGLILPQRELTSERLATEIQNMMKEPERLRHMAANARRVAITDAAERVASVCQDLVQHRGENS